MTSEAFLTIFFERQLYRFLLHASQEECDAFARGCGLTQEECEQLQSLYTEVQSGLLEEEFYEIFKEIINQHKEKELFYFGPSSETRQQQLNATYEKLLHNAVVVLRGPAQHAVHTPIQPASADIIVRLNFDVSSPVNNTEGTQRMDVLYHCCNGDVAIESLFPSLSPAIRMLCFERGVASRKLREECRRLEVPARDVSFRYSELASILGRPPSTGLLACYDLLSYGVQQVYLQGLTFFHTPYREDYPHSEGAADSVHDKDRELTFIKELVRRDSRLHVDAELQRLLTLT